MGTASQLLQQAPKLGEGFYLHVREYSPTAKQGTSNTRELTETHPARATRKCIAENKSRTGSWTNQLILEHGKIRTSPSYGDWQKTLNVRRPAALSSENNTHHTGKLVFWCWKGYRGQLPLHSKAEKHETMQGWRFFFNYYYCETQGNLNVQRQKNCSYIWLEN